MVQSWKKEMRSYLRLQNLFCCRKETKNSNVKIKKKKIQSFCLPCTAIFMIQIFLKQSRRRARRTRSSPSLWLLFPPAPNAGPHTNGGAIWAYRAEESTWHLLKIFDKKMRNFWKLSKIGAAQNIENVPKFTPYVNSRFAIPTDYFA